MLKKLENQCFWRIDRVTEIDVNALLIGKSGVGKSSLINYIYGSEVEKTGTGEPVTAKGIFEHCKRINEKCILHVYDTWGLEPDKAEEWNKLIQDELKKRNVADIREWFHFVIYCINAKSARIEQFEDEVIKELLKNNNKIIIVFTQVDGVNESVLNNMTDVLYHLGIEKDNIIRVCSVEKKLLDGKKTVYCGKEELLVRIQKNFWYSLCERIPNRIYQNAEKELLEVTKHLNSYVKTQINVFNVHSNRNFRRINKFCNDKYNECFKRINQQSNQWICEATDYYLAVCNTFTLPMSMAQTERIKEIPYRIYFEMDFTDKFAEKLAAILFMLIPVINVFVPTVLKELKIDEYKKQFDVMHQEMLESYQKMCGEFAENLSAVQLWPEDK